MERSALGGGVWRGLSREPYLLETSLSDIFAAGEGSMVVRFVHQPLADTGV